MVLRAKSVELEATGCRRHRMDAMVLGHERAPQKTVGFGDQATSLGKGCSRERTKHVSGSTLLGKTLHMPQATERADPPDPGS